MKTFFKFSILLLIIILNFCHAAHSQIELPFELFEDKHILVKIPGLKSNDSLTMYFDTGATITLLDKQTADKHELKADQQQHVSGASGTKSYDIATDQKIYLTPQVFLNHLNIVLEDLKRMNGSIGKSFDGIIGNDILKNYLTKIDFDKKRMYLYPFKEKQDTYGYTVIDFTFSNGIPIPQFPVTITLLNGETFSGDILFDSGAGLSLMLNTPFQKKNNIIKKAGKTVTTTQNNLSEKTLTTLTLIKSLSLGDYTFNDQILINVSSDNAGVSALSSYLGILGNTIINRFNLIIDYSTQKLYLSPNNFYHKAFTTAVSPLKLSQTDDKIIINSVIENSEAYSKGLREGDVIISINGIETTIEAYREMLLKEGNEIEIQYINNNNETKKCRFRLEKIF